MYEINLSLIEAKDRVQNPYHKLGNIVLGRSFNGLCEKFLHTFHMKICNHKTHLGVELLCSCILTN
jgi:hypothetical protein